MTLRWGLLLFLSCKLHRTKVLTAVIVWSLAGQGGPGQVVERLGLVAALVEIGGGLAGKGEAWEVQGHEGRRDAESDAPAVLRGKGPWLEQLPGLFDDLPDPGGPLLAETQIHGAQGIELKVEIAGVARLGSEEKLQAAVVADLVQSAGEGSADGVLFGLQTDPQLCAVVATLGFGPDGAGGQPTGVGQLQGGHLGPVGLRLADDGVNGLHI